MYPLSYSVLPGILIALMLGTYLVNRKDITYTKFNPVLILYLVFVAELSFMLFMELSGTERSQLWKFIYLFTYFMLSLLVLGYMFEHKYKAIYRLVYPLFSLIVSVIIIIFILMGHKGGIVSVSTGVPDTGIAVIRSFSSLPMAVWIVIFIIALFRKRFFLAAAGFFGGLSAFLCFSSTSRCFFDLNLVQIVHFIYLPVGIFLDYLKRDNYPVLPVFDNEEIMNSMPIGLLVIGDEGKSAYVNKYMRDMLGSENIRQWYSRNCTELNTGTDNDFSKTVLSIENRQQMFYVRKIEYSKLTGENTLYMIFDYSQNELLEKISNRYSEYLSSSISEKILEYHMHMKYHEMNEFLKGFAHNAFGMISVIKMGMEYITDSLSKIESRIYASKNLNKDREEIKSNYEILENTIKLSEVGVSKLNYSLKTLNNRVKMCGESDNVVIDLNQFVEQEIFFLINNTLHRYDLTLRTEYNADKLDVSFNYSMLAAVFQNILQFCIDELMLSRTKAITISTGKTNDEVFFRIHVNVHDYDAKKIDAVLDSAGFEEEEHYAQLIGALLIIKGSNLRIKRIDSRDLMFQISLV